MKKQMKSLIIGLVCVAVLVAVLLVLMFMPEKEEEVSSSSTVSTAVSTEVELLTLALADIESVEVKNTEEYTIVRDPEAENEWIIEELTGLPKVKNNYAMLALMMCDITAVDTIEENASDLAAYGLDDPTVVTAVMYDGSRHTIEVGSEAPGGDGYTYMKTPDSNTVYIINSSDVKRTSQVKTDYISTTIFTLNNVEALPTIMKMELGGTSREEIIKIESAADTVNAETTTNADSRIGFSEYRITEPKLRDTSATVFSELIETIFSTVVSGIEAYNVTDADLEKYGLADPYVTLRTSYQETVTDTSGNASTVNSYINYKASEMNEDGSFYLMYDDVPVIYKATIETDYTTDWYNAQYGDLASRLFVLPMINELDTVTVEVPDGEYLFDLTLVGAGTDDEKLNIHYNGKALDESVFKKFYQVLIGATAEDLVTDEPELSDPLATFTYKYVDESREPDVVTVYKGPTRYVYVAVNGEVEFTTRSAFIDKVYDSVPKVIENIEVSTNW